MKYSPADIINSWIHTKDGRLDRDSELMFSITTPFTEIKSVWPCLTSFAAQIIKRRLVKEATQAVRSSSGLHAVVSRKSSLQKAEWVDIGATTVPDVAGILQLQQPLTWEYLTSIAARKPRVRKGVVCVRKNRPVESVSIFISSFLPGEVIHQKYLKVCTHALAALNFSRNQQARRLPVAKGILFFAVSAPVDLFSYESRIGNMPSYSSIYRTLRSLADQETAATQAHGRDASKWGIMWIDNVQQYIRQRDLRIGRENQMKVGIAATYFEIDPEGFVEGAADLDDKRMRIAENKRKDLTIDQVLSWVDHQHLETVGVLHWLKVLTDYIPELESYRTHVSLLFRTRAPKHRIPARKTEVYPLATSGKNETVTTELKDALLDFFAQIGHLKTMRLVG